MGKASRRKRARGKPNAKHPHAKAPNITPAPRPRRLRRLLGWAIGSTIALVSGLLGIVSFVLPNLSVAPSTVRNPNRPLMTQFAVTNNGPITLTDVSFSSSLGAMTTDERGIDAITRTPKSSTVHDLSPRFVSAANGRLRTIEPQHTETFDSDLALWANLPWTYADIGIVLSYRVSFLPWRHKRLYRFETQKLSDGTLTWAPRSLDQ
jgi:hypothetical protein